MKAYVFRLRGIAVRWLCIVCCVSLAQKIPLLAHAQGSVVDARAVLAQQQARLGGAPGSLTLDRPASLDSDLVLGKGQSLQIAAPLTLRHGSIQLLGANMVTCTAPITVESPADVFIAQDAADISVRGCNVSASGRGGGYLLTATRSVRIAAENNHLLNVALFNTHNQGGPQSQTLDVTLAGNSCIFTGGAAPIGVYLMYVIRATVSNNRFAGTGHGIEWWGGDGNVGWHGAEAVTGAGDLSISGNQCYSAGGACVWGSMGFNVTVSGNSADICSYVCFDTEGGVRNLFTGNVAQHCGNGCYSAQMEGADAVFSGNFAYADAKAPALALVLIKHRQENPAPHANLAVTGNTLSCGNLCTAFYSEGADGLDLAHNTITNGLVVFANYTGTTRISNNFLRFTSPLADKVALTGPTLAGGHTALIERNTILDDSAAPNPRSACIAQSWSDNNSTDEMHVVGNTCINFETGILTETAGHNSGAPHALWFVAANRFSRVPQETKLVHRHRSGNESYNTEGSTH